MDLDAYVCEHAGQWRRLEHLTRKRRLAPPEVDELISLYQRTGTHLSVIRSRSPDPALVARLSRIVLAARGAITGGSAFSWRSVGRFFTATFPLAVLQAWRWWAAVGVAFTGLASLMMYYVAAHPDVQAAFLSDADIKQIVDSDFAGYYTANQARNFARNSGSDSNSRTSPRNFSSAPRGIGKKRQIGSPIVNSIVPARVKRQFIVKVACDQSVSTMPSSGAIPSFGLFVGPRTIRFQPSGVSKRNGMRKVRTPEPK